jgi:hypothetical protein
MYLQEAIEALTRRQTMSGVKTSQWFLLTALLLGVIGVSLSATIVAKSPEEKGMYPIPKDALLIDKEQLVARKTAAGKWQVCRMKRYLWQEPLVLLKDKSGKSGQLFRDLDLRDSTLPEGRGVYVVLQIAPKLYDSAKDAGGDKEVKKVFDDCDEVIISLERFHAPEFSIVKPTP